MSQKQIRASYQGQEFTITAEIPEGATNDQIQAAVGSYLKAHPDVLKKPKQTAPPNEPGFFRTIAQRLTSAGQNLYKSWKEGTLPVLPMIGLQEQWRQVPDQPTIGGKAAYAFPFFGPSAAEAADAAAEGRWREAAGILTADVAIPLVAPEAVRGGLSKVGELRAKVGGKTQGAAQLLTRSDAEHTTKPIVEKYLEKSEEAGKKQAEQDVAFREKVETAEKQQAAADTAFREKAGERIQSNLESEHATARRAGVERSLEEGSKRLGEQVQELDKQMRAEGNRRYGTVREAVANDPGVPATDLVNAVQHAESNILKGSQESIKQFREILGRQGEEQAAQLEEARQWLGMSEGEMAEPRMQSVLDALQQGTQGEVRNITFKDLQGYSSELGAKIAEGPKPGQGDVYQALKHVKAALDQAKTTIAERNGAGPALKQADAFWSQYMDAFYDKDSALTQVRRSIGVKDPKFYADPLRTGKMAEVAIGKLKNIKLPIERAEGQLPEGITSIGTQEGFGDIPARELYNDAQSGGTTFAVGPGENLIDRINETRRRFGAQEISQFSDLPGRIADLALNLREGTGELKTTGKPAKIKPMPKRTTVEQPKPPKPVEQPSAPTSEEIIEAKREAVRSKRSELVGLRRYDLMVLLAPLIRLPNLEGMALGAAAVAAEKGAAASLTHPKIMNWITRATAEDIAEVSRLPEPARSTLIGNLSQLMRDPAVSSGASPAIKNFVRNAQVAGTITPKPVQNRKEAKERLQKAQ